MNELRSCGKCRRKGDAGGGGLLRDAKIVVEVYKSGPLDCRTPGGVGNRSQGAGGGSL